MTWHSTTPLLRATLGLDGSAEVIHRCGYNADIDTGSVPEDIWNGGGLYTGFAAEAQTLDVVSADADDADAGAGATEVTLYGLDASGLEISETVVMDGVTPVTTTAEFLRMNSAVVTAAGATGTNEGAITIDQTTSGAVMAVMPAGVGRTQICAYTMPSDKRGAIVRWASAVRHTTGVWAAREGSIGLMVRPNGGAWQLIYPTSVGNTETGSPTFDVAGLALEPLTDVVARVTSISADNSAVASHLTIYQY